MRAAIDELHRAEARCEPAVFRGLAAGAPALRRWGGREGLAHLARVAGGAPVQVRGTPARALQRQGRPAAGRQQRVVARRGRPPSAQP